MCLFVLDEDFSLLYINSRLARAIEYRPEKLDGEFLNKLGRVGIKGLSYESLLSAIKRAAAGSRGAVETISTGKYSYLTLVPVRILHEKKEKNTVLIIIRGER
jgi:hypothetical protein